MVFYSCLKFKKATDDPDIGFKFTEMFLKN